MPKGRKPKPTKLKLLAGNPGKRPLNTKEPDLGSFEADPPNYLDEIARECWDYYVPRLRKAGVLQSTDLAVIASFCYYFSDWIKADELVKTMGQVVESPQGWKKNPAVTVRNEAMRLYHQMGAQLGLNPSDRSRIFIEKNDESPLLKLLKRNVPPKGD